MIPADKIYHILEDLKKLRQERGYTRIKFKGMREKMKPLVDRYHWNQDEFLDLVVRKGKILGYKNIKKELKTLNSLLNYIEKMVKKKAFAEALDAQKIDIEQFKKAIHFNKLKLKVLKDSNKECRKKMKRFITFIRIDADKNEFKKALAEWDETQAKIAYVDRLENSLERKVIVEQAMKSPKNIKVRTGMWKIATATAAAAILAFGAVTGSYTSKEGISFGGGSAMAGEVQQYKTVDDILVSVKNKVFVNKDTYLEEIKKSDKAIVFFYEVKRVEGHSGNLAKLYQQILNQFPQIKLICYDVDKENLSHNFYMNNFGFTGTPYFMMIKKGNKTFKKKGGPRNNQELDKWKQIMPKIIHDKLM